MADNCDLIVAPEERTLSPGCWYNDFQECEDCPVPEHYKVAKINLTRLILKGK
jgi:hypothetical protein